MNNRSNEKSVAWQILNFLASLKITVALLTISMVLVFFGTLAQVNGGMWEMMEHYFKSYLVWCKLDLLTQAFQYEEGTLPRAMGFPLPGGYTLGWMLLVNLLAAHIIRWQFNRKRIGIILIHASIIMLLVGMLITSVYQTEGNMFIHEGSKANSYRDSRYVELVVTEVGDTDDGSEKIYIVPHKRLANFNKPVIGHDETGLPFDLRVNQYFANSTLMGRQPGAVVFEGFGKDYSILAKAVTPGTQGGGGDRPSAWVSVSKNKDDVVNYLLSSNFEDMRQLLEIDGKSYYLSLRFLRYELPFTLRLKDFRFDRHPGTNQPKNFQSDVVLIDPDTGRQDKTIWMNHPLDHKGLTFFQASYDPDGERMTVLQVVGNPGSKLPYIACIVASVGLLWHFGFMLAGYLNRLQKRKNKAGHVVNGIGLKGQLIAISVVVLFGGWLISGVMRSDGAGPDGFDTAGFGRLPVQHGGRLKPLSTLGRDTLLSIQHKQRVSVYRFDVADVTDWEGMMGGLRGTSGKGVFEYIVKGAGFRLDAIAKQIQGLQSEGAKISQDMQDKNRDKLSQDDLRRRLDWRAFEIMVLRREETVLRDFVSVIRADGEIDEDQKIKIATGLNVLLHRPDFYNAGTFNSVQLSDKTTAYTGKINELGLNDLVLTNLEVLNTAYPKIVSKPKKKLLSASRWLLDVNAKRGYGYYDPVIRLDSPEVIEALGWTHQNQKYFSFAQLVHRHRRVEREQYRIRRAQSQDKKKPTATDAHFMTLDSKLNSFLHAMFDRTSSIGLASVDREKQGGGTWIGFMAKGQENVRLYGLLFDAYARGDIAGYQTTLDQLTNIFANGNIAKRAIEEDAYEKTQIEDRYTSFEPFYKAQTIYLIVILLVIFTWVKNQPLFYSIGVCLLSVAFITQTAAMGVRMYMSGRPPVIDLYSSAVFIGWAVVLMSFYVEYILPRRSVIFVSATIAALTLMVAKGLEFEASPGDTLKPLQAVLDTNFWLATHVVIVTLGYAAAFLAGITGVVYIVKACVFKGMSKADQKIAISTMYGVVCFSLICSLIGTVLGGIWADYSWGRFWGWDPKENGALMIVIWNAVILHARWAGLVKRRGIAILSVVGGMVVAWSWFGTNMLGVGLHSYGFIGAAFTYLLGFWVLMLVFVVHGVFFNDELKTEAK